MKPQPAAYFMVTGTNSISWDEVVWRALMALARGRPGTLTPAVVTPETVPFL